MELLCKIVLNVHVTCCGWQGSPVYCLLLVTESLSSRTTLTSTTSSGRLLPVRRPLCSVWWRLMPREFDWNTRLSSCQRWAVTVRDTSSWLSVSLHY